MIVFLTTSYNQSVQYIKLYNSLLNKIVQSFKFIVVESGKLNTYIDNENENAEIIIIKENEDSYWSKSIHSGLSYVDSKLNHLTFQLVILNCDVELDEWDILNKNHNKLTSFFKVKNNIIKKSGLNITNYYFALHDYPMLGHKFEDLTHDLYVNIVATRLIIIPAWCVPIIKDIKPKYNLLPHYCADFVFTYHISQRLGMLWTMSKSGYIIEDESTTGNKNLNVNFSKRIKYLLEIKSTYNIKDRIIYSILISKCNYFYVIASTLKCLVSVIFKITSVRSRT
jgi:hypothetical protein